VFFSEVELSDIDESHDECELSSLGNEDEFYDFDEILIDSDFDLKDHEWHGETSRQGYSQEADLHTEGSETGASDSASGSSEEREDDDDIGASDSASNSSEEKGGISTDDEAGLIHGANVTRQSKDPRLGKTSYLLEVGSSSSIPAQSATEDGNISQSSAECFHQGQGHTRQLQLCPGSGQIIFCKENSSPAA
jgi:hypothetical protein